MEAGVSIDVHQPAASISSTVPDTPNAATGVFVHRGDYWHIVFGGEVCHLKDTKGLRYVAELLRRPGEKVSSLELIESARVDGPGSGAASSAGASGTERQRSIESAYRDRLDRLRADLAVAQANANAASASILAEEIDFLVEKLTRLKPESTRSTAKERARLTVTKGIGAALRKIAAGHPTLGAHLGATIRRGYACSYTPDPRSPIVWVGSP